jgi:hypothetical protein
MNRYRSYGERDDQPQVVGDGAFKGVDEYNAIENIAEGEVQQAVNMDFTSQDAVTRGGFMIWPTTYYNTNEVAFVDSFNQPLTEFDPIIVFGNNYYICMVIDGGDYKFYKSFDLKSYTLLPTTFSATTFTINSFVFIPSSSLFGINQPSRFVWVGKNNSTSTGVSYFSSDAESWSLATNSSFPASPPYPSGIGSFTTALTIVADVAFASGFSPRAGTTYNDYYYLYSSLETASLDWKKISTTSRGQIKQMVLFKGFIIASFYLYNTSSTTEFNWSSYLAYYTGSQGGAGTGDGDWTPCNIPIKTGVSPNSPPPIAQLSVGEGGILFCTFEVINSEEKESLDIWRSYNGIDWEFSTSINNQFIPYDVELFYNFIYFNGFYIIPYRLGFASQDFYSTLYGDYLVQRPLRTPRVYNLVYTTEYYYTKIKNIQLVNGRLIATRGVGVDYGVPYKISEIVDSISVYASMVYTDPKDPGSQWVALVGSNTVTFYSSTNMVRIVDINGQIVRVKSTIIQCNNLVYIFRGPDETPLYWDGDWSAKFELAPTPTPASGFQVIPNSDQATYYQNRLWVKKGKDEILASDVLDFNTYETITNSFNLNTGSSDYIVATFPFGDKTLLVFKNKSIIALTNVDGSLADVTATEVTRQVGLVGIRAVTSVGPDMAYVSYKNVNLITLTATNNSVQHKTLPLSFKIKKIMDRVNWDYAYKISLGYADNKLYVALPLDNSMFCNAVAVYNFVTGQWYGEWNFADGMNMCIQDFQVVDYIGLQKIHAVTEDGRIFACETGKYDVHNLFVNRATSEGFDYSLGVEINTKLVTRAYDTSGLNHYQRRMALDLATSRPKFSVVSYTEGASESSTIVSNQTYSRSESWKFNDSTYDMTNANDDYNRAYRKDYSVPAGGPIPADVWGPSDFTGVEPQSGFLPEMLQEYRLPLMTTRQGRLSWVEITNTQGTINIMSAGFETRPGQRSNLIQV